MRPATPIARSTRTAGRFRKRSRTPPSSATRSGVGSATRSWWRRRASTTKPGWMRWVTRTEPSKVPAPAGLTVSAVDVEAPGVTRAPAETTAAPETGSGQRQDRSSRGATEWIFGGGDIKLNILISIYIIDRFAAVPQLLKIIMEHEYLHVRDNLKLAAEIGRKIDNDDAVKRWLNGERWTGS